MKGVFELDMAETPVGPPLLGGEEQTWQVGNFPADGAHSNLWKKGV